MRRVRTELKLLSIAISEDMWIGAFSFPILHWNVNASQPRAMPFVLVDHDFMSWSEQGRGQRGAPFTTPLSFPNSSRRVRVDKRVEIRNWQFGKGQRKDYGHDDLISRLLFPPRPRGRQTLGRLLMYKEKEGTKNGVFPLMVGGPSCRRPGEKRAWGNDSNIITAAKGPVTRIGCGHESTA